MSVENVSPANPAPRAIERKRVPMAVPQQKLQVQEIPGYHLYWMKGTPDRLQRALNGGYEFVDISEVPEMTNTDIAGDVSLNSSSDLGSRVSVIAGDEVGPDGQPVRLYLMKIKQEWHEEDLAIQAKPNEALIDALKAGTVGSEKRDPRDSGTTYVGQQTSPHLFQPKSIRRS